MDDPLLLIAHIASDSWRARTHGALSDPWPAGKMPLEQCNYNYHCMLSNNNDNTDNNNDDNNDIHHIYIYIHIITYIYIYIHNNIYMGLVGAINRDSYQARRESVWEKSF